MMLAPLGSAFTHELIERIVVVQTRGVCEDIHIRVVFSPRFAARTQHASAAHATWCGHLRARDFAFAVGHRLPLCALREFTAPMGAGGFLLISPRCNFRRSPSSRNLPIMFAGYLIGAERVKLCPDANSRSRSAPASAAFSRASRRPRNSITTTP